MHRILPFVLALGLLAGPAHADDSSGDSSEEPLPGNIAAGYGVGSVLVVTGVVTGVVGVLSWFEFGGIEGSLYGVTRPRHELDADIARGNDIITRAIVFSAVSGVTLSMGVATLATTSDKHEEWKQRNSESLLHRRRPRLAGVGVAPTLDGISGGLVVRW